MNIIDGLHELWNSTGIMLFNDHINWAINNSELLGADKYLQAIGPIAMILICLFLL